MMEAQTTTSDFDNICRVCFQEGNVSVAEILPYGAAMICTHTDGKKHRWTKYTSIASLGKRKSGRPVEIICPRCEKKGTINYYRPNVNRTDRIAYIIRHERIKGTWGKAKLSKIRRCYIRDKKHKEILRRHLEAA